MVLHHLGKVAGNALAGSNPVLSARPSYTLHSILERYVWECGMVKATANDLARRLN